MSSKAKALLKKLRNKSIEEKEKNRKETPEPQGIRTIGTMVEDPRRKVISVPKSIKDEKYNVDPLDYFKTEHINIEAMNMSEYAPKVEIKEVDEKKTDGTNSNNDSKKLSSKNSTSNDANLNNSNNNTKVTIKPTATIGPTSQKINFLDILKARNKIKKSDNSPTAKVALEIRNKKTSDNRKNMSMEPRNVMKGVNKFLKPEEKKEERRILVKSVDKKTDDNSQNLYVKLILARNRYNQNHIIEENVYQNIVNLVEELNAIKDMPKELSNEINSLLQKLELPQHLIIDKDVQEYVPEEQFVPLVANPLPLDQVLKKLNITEN
jgi:hypothetical protein